MSCGLGQAKPDWKAYILGEMDTQARRAAEAHASSCADCQEEVGSLRVTLDAMATLREEEMPRRLAFVSDKVFEPKWWQMFLRPSFAAAAVIAAAILVHAFVRPIASQPAQVASSQMNINTLPMNTSQMDTAAMEARVSAEVSKRVEAQLNAALANTVNATINSAVTKAVADARKNDAEHTAQLLAAAERRYGQSTELMTRQVTQMYAMNTGLGVR